MSAPENTVRVACHAMATRFEFILHGHEEAFLQAAGEEAMQEIQRLERELGFYQASSEIAWLNQRAADEAVKVSPLLFELLKQAGQLHRDSNCTFDVTVAPLLRCWGLAGGRGRFPAPEEIEAARALVGMDLLQLDRETHTVRFAQPGVLLDLGSIGKGFALDVAAEWLRETGVESALIHGGTSTVFAIGSPPEADAWKVAIVRPEAGPELGELASKPIPNQLLAKVELSNNESLSVSAVWGKSFHHEGTTYGHVIDPRTGWPVSGAFLAAVVLPSATETDALSTALLTLGRDGHATLSKSHPKIRTLVALPRGDAGDYDVIAEGIEMKPPPSGEANGGV